MGLISKDFTFTTGSTIIASEHNTNFDTLYNEINGNLDNGNIKANAGIVDSKLAQITTASKVTGDALTDLDNVPSGAGTLPEANLPSNIDFNFIGLDETTAPSTAANQGALYTKESGGQTELFFREESDGDEVQLTSAGRTNAVLDSWVAHTFNTNIQVLTDGFVTAYVNGGASGNDFMEVKGFTDASATPSVVRAWDKIRSNNDDSACSITMPVKKNDYYKVTKTDPTGSPTSALFFIPLGD